jgi:hypothetical protein
VTDHRPETGGQFGPQGFTREGYCADRRIGGLSRGGLAFCEFRSLYGFPEGGLFHFERISRRDCAVVDAVRHGAVFGD